jgi:hypothetical protein
MGWDGWGVLWARLRVHPSVCRGPQSRRKHIPSAVKLWRYFVAATECCQSVDLPTIVSLSSAAVILVTNAYLVALLESYLLSIEVQVNLRPTVSRPVCSGVRRPSGTCDQFFFRHEMSFRQMRLCYFVAPSLTRGRVCNLLLNCFWALQEQSLLSRSPAELTVHLLFLSMRTHPTVIYRVFQKCMP